MAEVKPFVWGASGVELLQTGDTLAGVSAGGGDLSLLSTATISSPVATVDFTGLDGTYYKYIVEYYGVNSTETAALLCQVQVGGTWQTSNYYGAYIHLQSGTAQGNNADNNASILYGNITTGSRMAGKIELGDINNTTVQKTIEATYRPTAINIYRKQYFYSSVSAVTGLRFILSAGNIAAGTFKLYGLKA